MFLGFSLPFIFKIVSLKDINLLIKLLINKNVFINAFNQLSLSGGGSYGAIQIGILKKVIETDYKNYDLYTGISTGALNAGILSYYSDINVGTDIRNINIIHSKR